jgi:hypothetical protein
MAASDPITLSVTTMAVTTSLGAFYQMLPPISEVRKRSAGEPEFAADVRMGELMATAITFGIGGIASSLSGSPVPALVSVLFAVSLIGMYEMTLRSDRPLEQ